MSAIVRHPAASPPRAVAALIAIAGLVILVSGCGQEGPATTTTPGESGELQTLHARTPPPSGLVTVNAGSDPLTFWPWTGNSFDGTPVDPVNLLFTGPADPVSLRQALLSLDGDRTAYGFPDVSPFNLTWSDAAGDVQTCWAEGDGWLGSVVQLQLGDYDPVRVHLRLFGTGQPCGHRGRWTIGAAHFELRIPGTADHQVLSWELAQQVVLVDLMRSHLLDSTTPMIPTGPINDAPSWRTIPAVIYNLLPPELIGAIGGPPQPAVADVPLASDGQGTILNVTTPTPIRRGRTNWSRRFEYGQLVPRPFCSSGPGDYVYVEGPVDFTRHVMVDRFGRLSADASYHGTLTITPMDVTQNPPVPTAPSFTAEVGEMQSGWIARGGFSVMMDTDRITHPAAGTEFQKVRLLVRSDGHNAYVNRTKCLTP